MLSPVYFLQAIAVCNVLALRFNNGYVYFLCISLFMDLIDLLFGKLDFDCAYQL